MRLDRVTLRGLGPFRDQVTLDMAELGDAKLVAVCGDNGEGKSTLLEFALPGAFYRKTPTQGSLRERAMERESLLEVSVTGSESYTIRHLVDGVSGKGESVVLDAAGRPVSGSSKVSDYDAWAAKVLPPEEVLLASTFGAQQDRGFLGAKPSDRKAILLRALGIARYEAWAAKAGEHARDSRQALEVTLGRLGEAQRGAGDLKTAEQAVSAANEAAEQLDAALAQARADLEGLERQAREAEQANASRSTHIARHAELSARAGTLREKLADTQRRIAACERTLAQEPGIRQAAERLQKLLADADSLAHKRTELRSSREAARADHHGELSRAEEARGHVARVAARLDELKRLVARGADFTAAAEELSEVEDTVASLREELRGAQAAVDDASSQAVAGAEQRVQELRGGLQGVIEEASLDAAQERARAALQDDDHAVQEVAERPARLRSARSAVERCQGRLSAAEKRQREVSALARRAGEVAAAKDQIGALQTEAKQHRATAARLEAAAAEALKLKGEMDDQLQQLAERHRALTGEADRCRPLADQLPNVALASSKVSERREQLAELGAELKRTEAELEQLGAPPEPAPVPAVEPARAKATQLDAKARQAHRDAAVAASKVETARAAQEQIRALKQEQRAQEAELADWKRLAEDLGRKGLQAAEIDSCGPELTAMVNDLLHSAHGPRYSVRIDTQKLSADGKKTLEGCQVTVIDTVRGREDEGSKFSGGERVIIGEAMALGLSMLACQRSGLRGATLVRDETGAALDPDNAEVYVTMLRRAAELLGADRVLFVCHNPEVSDLADARITVSDGQLLVDAQGHAQRRVA